MSNFDKVKDFMNAYDQEVLDKPSLPTFEVAQLRTELIKEEFTELIDAINKMDIVEVADALTDILYVTYGAGHAMGINLDKCFEEVHNSNMSKMGSDGKAVKGPTGKVMKGPNYKPPDLKKVIMENNNGK
jgi:predicted HAD superfamily Cof-like phosphohydrolase